jgi:hypothetical protein
LLLSRACFRFGSTTQNSNRKTIFTTCLNSRPLSERNALTHLIEIEGHKFTLYKFDEQMKDVLAFSRKNILYTLSILKKVIELKTLV